MSTPLLPAPRFSVSRILRNDFFMSALVGVVLTALSFLVAFASGWIQSANWFEVGATAFNYASFYLCVKQRRLYYLVGILGYLFFVVVYLQAHLLASTALSAYLSVALIVGFFMWRRDDNTLPVSRVAWKWWPVYVLTTVAAYVGAVLIVTALGGSFAFWDSVILVFTILAQFLLDRKKIENWAVWIVFVNGAGFILYMLTGLYLVAIQQLLFGIFSMWGWYEWQKSRKPSPTPVMHNSKFDGALADYAKADLAMVQRIYDAMVLPGESSPGLKRDSGPELTVPKG